MFTIDFTLKTLYTDFEGLSIESDNIFQKHIEMKKIVTKMHEKCALLRAICAKQLKIIQKMIKI